MVGYTVRIQILLLMLFAVPAFAVPAGVMGIALTPDAPPPIQPNVLMIIVDDLNDIDDDYFAELVPTNIDALAASGVRFTNAFANAPMCRPSRVALMLGISPETSLVDGTADNNYRDDPGVPEIHTRTSVPQHYSDSGYRIVGAGKIFHHQGSTNGDAESDNLSIVANNFTAWDDFDLHLNLDVPNDDYTGGSNPMSTGGIPPAGLTGLTNVDPYNLRPNDDWGLYEAQEPPLTNKTTTHPDYKRRTWAIDQINSVDGAVVGVPTAPADGFVEPVFVAVGFFKPHTPQICPGEYRTDGAMTAVPIVLDDADDIVVGDVMGDPVPDLAMITATADDFPPGVNHHEERLRSYVGCVQFIDDLVGDLMVEVDGSGEEWLVVLLGDHGYMLGEHQRQEKFAHNARSSQVTLIISGHRIPSGLEVDEPVTLLDVGETMFAYSAIDVRDPGALAPFEGNSLARFIDSTVKPTNQSIRMDWFDLATMFRHWISYRSKAYSYTTNLSNGNTEFYDLSADPNENTNLDYPVASTVQAHIDAKLDMETNHTPNP